MKAAVKIGKLLCSPELFRTVCMTAVLLLHITPLTAQIVPYMKLLHIYALLVIMSDLCGERRIIRNKGRVCLALFVLFYGVTVLCNPSLLTLSDLSAFGYEWIVLAVVYSYGGEDARICIVFHHVTLAVIALLNAASIVMFFEKIRIYVPSAKKYIGMFLFENRLSGLCGNPNVLAAVSMVGMVFCALAFVRAERKRRRYWYFLPFSIDLIAMLLANSRAAIYSLITVCAVCAGLTVSLHVKGIRGMALALCAAAVAAGAVFGVCRAVQYGLSVTEQAYLALRDEAAEQGGEASAETDDGGGSRFDWMESTVVRDKDSGLSGREEVWRGGLRAFLRRPLFGYGTERQQEAFDEAGVTAKLYNGGLHNAYLEVLLAYGLAGFLCLAGFLIAAAGGVIRFFRSGESARREEAILLTAVLCGYALYALVESTPMHAMEPTPIAIWYLMSRLVGLTEGGACSPMKQ